MKEGLVKLTDEDNIFYDSIEKMYRYMMHCPKCYKISGCRCFEDLEDAEEASTSGLDFCCSSKCSIDMLDSCEDERIKELMQELHIEKDIKDLTEEDASLILEDLCNDYDSLDYDYMGGDAC